MAPAASADHGPGQRSGVSERCAISVCPLIAASAGLCSSMSARAGDASFASFRMSNAGGDAMRVSSGMSPRRVWWEKRGGDIQQAGIGHDGAAHAVGGGVAVGFVDHRWDFRIGMRGGEFAVHLREQLVRARGFAQRRAQHARGLADVVDRIRIRHVEHPHMNGGEDLMQLRAGSGLRPGRRRRDRDAARSPFPRWDG